MTITERLKKCQKQTEFFSIVKINEREKVFTITLQRLAFKINKINNKIIEVRGDIKNNSKEINNTIDEFENKYKNKLKELENRLNQLDNKVEKKFLNELNKQIKVVNDALIKLHQKLQNQIKQLQTKANNHKNIIINFQKLLASTEQKFTSDSNEEISEIHNFVAKKSEELVKNINEPVEQLSNAISEITTTVFVDCIDEVTGELSEELGEKISEIVNSLLDEIKNGLNELIDKISDAILDAAGITDNETKELDKVREPLDEAFKVFEPALDQLKALA